MKAIGPETVESRLLGVGFTLFWWLVTSNTL